MKKLIVNAVLMVEDDCSTRTLNRMLMGLAEPSSPESLHSSSVGITSVHFKPTTGLNRTVWIYDSCNEDDPYFLVEGPGDRESSRPPLTALETDRLFEEGVCVGMHGSYPRADRYETPGWAAVDRGCVVPSMEGFFISDDFSAMSNDSGDDTPEEFWFKIALSEESELLTK